MDSRACVPAAVDQRLRSGATHDVEGVRRVSETFLRRAQAQDLVDVAVERHDSPLGCLLVAGTRTGVVRIGLPSEEEAAVLEELARRISGRVLRAPRPAVTAARRALDEYFAARRTAFDLPLDWRLTTGFRRRVLEATARIPYGGTASYAEMAAQAGSPRAVRAAGTALATNPLPIVIPCHRVRPAGGGLGGYRGGAPAKAALLALEAADGVSRSGHRTARR